MQVIFVGVECIREHLEMLLTHLPQAHYIIDATHVMVDELKVRDIIYYELNWSDKIIKDKIYEMLYRHNYKSVVVVGYQKIDKELRQYLGKAKQLSHFPLIIHINDDEAYASQVRNREMWYNEPLSTIIKQL